MPLQFKTRYASFTILFMRMICTELKFAGVISCETPGVYLAS